jgi:UPF0716 protein FxsA
MFFKLLTLFTVVPVVELYILIKLGGLIGALPTIGIILFTGIAGASLARMQGANVWRLIRLEIEAGKFPADRLIDGLLLIVAGAVLITPGILTDVFGFLLLLPPSRKPFRSWIKKRLRRMMDGDDVHLTGFLR